MQISGNAPRPQFQPQAGEAKKADAAAAPSAAQGAERAAAAQEARPAPAAGDRYGTASDAGSGGWKGSSLSTPDTLQRRSRREPAPGECGPGGLPYGPLGSTNPSALKEVKVGEGPFDPKIDPSKLGVLHGQREVAEAGHSFVNRAGELGAAIDDAWKDGKCDKEEARRITAATLEVARAGAKVELEQSRRELEDTMKSASADGKWTEKEREAIQKAAERAKEAEEVYKKVTSK